MGQAIFIGYRRADTADVAGRLYDGLSLAFGEGKIFKDVDSIPVGADFAAHIGKVLPQCRVFLALIGPEWASARDANGALRIDDPNDLVRIEIEKALATPKLLVAPVLVNNARMPDQSEVPESLRPLLQRHAAILRGDPDFKNDVARLVQALREHLRTGRLNLQPLGGAARVAANAAGLSGWVVAAWIGVAGVGVTAAVPQLREPLVNAATTMLQQPETRPATTETVAAQITAPIAGSSAAMVQPVTEEIAPPPPAESAPQSLGNGLSVVLVSLAEQQDPNGGYFASGRYIATLRFQNSSGADAGVAVERENAGQGQMVLTDGRGGSCSMIANGEGWGSMSAEWLDGEGHYGTPDFRPIPANGQTQQTIFFNMGRCDTNITGRTGLTISGTFVVSENNQRRAAPIFFGDLSFVGATRDVQGK